MKDGFIKTAAITPLIRVADCVYNTNQIIDAIQRAKTMGVNLLVFPELAVTGYTCGDLFFQQALIQSAKESAEKIAQNVPAGMVVVFGCPVDSRSKLYNCAIVASNASILGIVPKANIPNYQEFYEARWFSSAREKEEFVEFNGQSVPLSMHQIFTCTQMPSFRLAVEICEDLWVPCPPSVSHAVNGATVIANLSASDEFAGKARYRKDLVNGQSARLICGYVYCDAGEGESTTDLVFTGHDLICENGVLLAQHAQKPGEILATEIDLQRIEHERRMKNTFFNESNPAYRFTDFQIEPCETDLTRPISRNPFIPEGDAAIENRCDKILNLQALGLKRRISHTSCKSLVIGLSGGLDSTLALLVSAQALDMLGMSHKNIIAITMPCFGTTNRTKSNAQKLAEAMDCTLRIIDIKASVTQHFADIGHDETNYNVVYENAQARERTQILMDVANQVNGLVVGTGDLSELALGWATFNGDHMSNYAVNASVPKTLVRYIVDYYANSSEPELRDILKDILATPISPELLPSDGSAVTQETEDLVGPYELHDFFIYYCLRWGCGPAKIFRLARYAFDGSYDKTVIMKWLKIFYRRFFNQQFKRSCLPDAPKVGSVTLSPRGDWRMPSDAKFAIWLDELDEISEDEL